MNKVVLIGRLTKEPELRKTPTDLAVCQFTIAVNRDYTPKDGEKQADFINCVAWRNQAENLCKYQHKGSLIAIDGSIQTRSYDDPNGVKKFVTEVLVNQITFLESKKETPSAYEQAEQRKAQEQEQFDNQFGNIQNKNDISGDDLPF